MTAAMRLRVALSRSGPPVMSERLSAALGDMRKQSHQEDWGGFRGNQKRESVEVPADLYDEMVSHLTGWREWAIAIGVEAVPLDENTGVLFQRIPVVRANAE